MKNCRTAALVIAAIAVTVGFQTYAKAQVLPNKPIQLLIPTSPGGGTDAVGRALADALSVSLKQSVVPINKPGASGIIADQTAAHASPDGSTLLLAVNTHTVNPALYKKLPFDPLADFTPIASIGRSPMVLVAGRMTGVKNIREMLDLAKKNPESMSFGVAEASSRIAVEQLSQSTGVPLTAIPYKGTGPIATDLAGGTVNFSVITIAATAPLVSSGKIVFIAVMSPNRSSLLPDVPTLAEQGIAGAEVNAWWGLLGPAAMPPKLVDRLNEDVRAALANPDVKKRLLALSVEPWVLSPREFDGFLRTDVARTLGVAKRRG